MWCSYFSCFTANCDLVPQISTSLFLWLIKRSLDMLASVFCSICTGYNKLTQCLYRDRILCKYKMWYSKCKLVAQKANICHLLCRNCLAGPCSSRRQPAFTTAAQSLQCHLWRWGEIQGWQRFRGFSNRRDQPHVGFIQMSLKWSCCQNYWGTNAVSLHS